MGSHTMSIMSELVTFVEALPPLLASIELTPPVIKGILLVLYVVSGIFFIRGLMELHPIHFENPVVMGISIVYMPLMICGIIVGLGYRSADSPVFRREMFDFFTNFVKSLFRVNKEFPDMRLIDYLFALPSMIQIINQVENPPLVEPQVESSEED